MEPEIDYAVPGPLTGLEGTAPEVLEGIGNDPVQVCMPVHLLVVQPDAARDLGLAEARLGERNLRPAAQILGRLLTLNPADSHRKRELAVMIRGILTEDFHGRVLPFDERASVWYADIVTGRERTGSPIGVADAQIAAICRDLGAILATRNTADFEETGIELINPWKL